MCIICVKKAGVERPKNEWLDQMCKRNSDGFGIAYYRNGKTTVKKTLNAEEYKQWVRSLPQSVPAIMHMRIATHGSVRVGNCHPFLSGDGKVAFAHNGILSLDNEKDKTDSETFFRRIALPVSKVYPIGSKEFDAMVDSLIGTSKFAFMQDGNLTTYGKYIEDEGLLFSNDSYKPYQWSLPIHVKGKGKGKNMSVDYEYDDDDYDFNRWRDWYHDNSGCGTQSSSTYMRVPTKEEKTQFYMDWFSILEALDEEGHKPKTTYPDYKLYSLWRDDVSAECSSYEEFQDAWNDYYGN